MTAEQRKCDQGALNHHISIGVFIIHATNNNNKKYNNNTISVCMYTNNNCGLICYDVLFVHVYNVALLVYYVVLHIMVLLNTI